LDQELDEEMRFHLERDIEQTSKRHDSGRRALRGDEVVRRRGPVEGRMSHARGVGLIENMLRDVSYSVRVLLKSYAFTIVVVLTLALGIGANTAIFSFANGILLRPLPYPQSDRLAVLDETALKQRRRLDEPFRIQTFSTGASKTRSSKTSPSTLAPAGLR
jgi:hypothetical protein